jgi:hypothetical protein
MAEPLRKDKPQERDDNQLSTADIARGGARPHDAEQRVPPQSVPELGALANQNRRAVDESSSANVLTKTGPEAFDSPAVPADGPPPLFSGADVQGYRARWSDIQLGFVDQPRQAVEDADELVAAVMKKLAEGFAGERAGLEKQWDRGDNVSTEDLRVALQRYRSFFDRLLKL